MTRPFLLLPVLVLALGACTTTAQSVPASANEHPRAAIAFVEKPGGPLHWDFEIHGLPAVDPSSGAIIVADVSHGQIASSLSLSLRWLRPGRAQPARSMAVLDDMDTSRVLYETDEADGAVETGKLAQRVDTQTRAANAILSAQELRPLVACTVGPVCTQPQRFTCGGDIVEKRWDAVPPMSIGDGPPKEMVTCAIEAHLDPVTMQLAARLETSCKEPAGDACYLPPEWRVTVLR